MHTQLAARIDQPVDHQQLQHLLPTDCFPPLRQSILPETVQSQLAPQIACQPAVSEGTRSPELQATQLHLQAVYDIGGNFSIFRKQTQRARTLPIVVGTLQNFSPST